MNVFCWNKKNGIVQIYIFKNNGYSFSAGNKKDDFSVFEIFSTLNESCFRRGRQIISQHNKLVAFSSLLLCGAYIAKQLQWCRMPTITCVACCNYNPLIVMWCLSGAAAPSSSSPSCHHTHRTRRRCLPLCNVCV